MIDIKDVKKGDIVRHVGQKALWLILKDGHPQVGVFKCGWFESGGRATLSDTDIEIVPRDEALRIAGFSELPKWAQELVGIQFECEYR